MTQSKRFRHILGLSGGKDSTALAVLLHKKIPQMEYFFCDTGKELPETYEYLERLKARLGISIVVLKTGAGFDHWLEMFNGMLPSPNMRWCTKQLKIVPLEHFIGDDDTYSYVGIRGDESRDGYISTKPNIKPVYPYKGKDFKTQDDFGKIRYDQSEMLKELRALDIELPVREFGYALYDVQTLLSESGIGLPEYYRWRSRSGCFFCFFQRKIEWVRLAENHPDLFEKAAEYEEVHSDGRTYFWNQNESLRQLIARKNQIIADHEKQAAKGDKTKTNRPLSEVLGPFMDSDSDDLSCLICHL